jgi:uncharacterized protein YegP (UPF0339 family)
MIITKSLWEDIFSTLHTVKSTEAIADEMDSSPPGGSTGSDADEQNNESDFGSDDLGDLGGGMDDFGGDDFGMGGDSDMGGGDMGGMGGGGDGSLGTGLKPEENPFKGQNGRALLDTKLAELSASVQNSLELVQSNTKIDKVVVEELTSLNGNVRQVREVVFTQPVETTQYRWALCAKAYELICKKLCQDMQLSKQQESNN